MNNGPDWIKVDGNPGDTADRFVRCEAIILVEPYMQMGRSSAPVPGETSTTPPRPMEARGSTVKLTDGTVRTITGLTPNEVVNICSLGRPEGLPKDPPLGEEQTG
jgi:hypothetical protein